MKKLMFPSKSAYRNYVRRPVITVITMIVVIVLSLATGLIFGTASIGLAFIPVFGPSLVDGYKKWGYSVFSHNHYGVYSRSKKNPKNPKSVGQSTQRQSVKNFSKHWKDVGVDQATYNDYGATHPVEKRGRIIYLTGEATFVSFNLIAQTCTGSTTLVTAPPVTPALFPILTGGNIEASIGPDLIDLQPDKIGDYITGMKLEVFVSPPLSAGTFTQKHMTLLGVYDPSPTTPIDITGDYVDKYGTIANSVGQKIFCQFRLIMPTGESNLYQKCNTTILAIAP